MSCRKYGHLNAYNGGVSYVVGRVVNTNNSKSNSFPRISNSPSTGVKSVVNNDRASYGGVGSIERE